MKIRGYDFDFYNRTYVMGILNVTPDSFSDGGRNYCLSDAVSNAMQMIEDGVDIIDIGGESTRPGFTEVSLEEELSRVIPVVESIRRERDIPISVDTTKALVARKSLEAGADIINDVSGLFKEKEMADVAVEFDCPTIVMYDGAYFEKRSGDYLDILLEDVGQMINYACDRGIDKSKLIIDPGVGFSKSFNENLLTIKYLDKLHTFGLPTLLGCSRKSVIGNALGLEKTQRLEGTIASSILAAVKGTGIVRVHDVIENVRAIRMYEAIENAK